jgi:hydroxypyruvate isomerase
VIDFSVCIETAFAEQDRSFPDRVRAAADAGFGAVEIWDWRGKPLRDLDAALRQTGTRLHTLCVEDWRDKCQLGDPAAHPEFLTRVSQAAKVGMDLGVPKLVVLAGDALPGVDRGTQLDAVSDVLARASDAIAAYPIELLIEVVNRQHEGLNAVLQDSQSALELLRQLARPNVRYLYDRYHAILNGEALGRAIESNMDLVGHVQAADVPGRHEFGTGTHDWVAEFTWLLSAGYTGYVGIEATFIRSGEIVLAQARSLLEQARRAASEARVARQHARS